MKFEQVLQELRLNGVRFEKLQDLAEISTGSSNTNEAEGNGAYPFYVRSQEPLRKNSYEYDETAIITAGDGVGVGKVFHYVEGKYALHQRAYRIHITSKEILPKFFFHYMRTKFYDYISKAGFHSSVSSIRRPMLNNFLIPILPLDVQAEIIRILDDYTVSIVGLQQELEKELTARKKQYEYYSSKLFLDTNAPEIEMSELASFVYGYTDTAQDVGDTRFVRITDINEQGYLKQEDQKFITLNEDAHKSLLNKGDIIMARTGATFGKVLYFDSDFPSVYASFLIKIIPNKRLLSRYYWHFTKTPLYWEQANKLVTTGGQPQFNTPAVKRVKIPVPSIEEQERIVSILDRFDKLCNDISEGLPAEIEVRRKQYEYYRDKLLSFEENKNA